VPRDLRPKPPKEGYLTKPNWNEIEKMSLKEL
jgi:hypothetical protein